MEPETSKIDTMLDALLVKVEGVENTNIALKGRIIDLEAQLTKHTNDGSLTDAQLKKLQDATARLSNLV